MRSTRASLCRAFPHAGTSGESSRHSQAGWTLDTRVQHWLGDEHAKDLLTPGMPTTYLSRKTLLTPGTPLIEAPVLSRKRK